MPPPTPLAKPQAPIGLRRISPCRKSMAFLMTLV